MTSCCHPWPYRPVLACLALLLVSAAQAHDVPAASSDRQPHPLNPRPHALRGPVQETVYDGISDDLLTAGLGKTGLMGAAPAFANPLAPTAAELRRNAIHTNYRALVDYTVAGGMGRLYGPNIDVSGLDTLGEGQVPGREYIAWADDGSGRQNVVLMVQVPDSFNPDAACIVTATSSGSRGIYGAIATAGEWGLKHGCAVAYSDKGTGNGLHDLMSGTVIGRDGRLLNAATAGAESGFTAALDPVALAAFNTATPHRVAYKHAHSQQNPERDWGRHTLDAVRLAFYLLNQRYPALPGRHGEAALRIRKANTVVIASSVSNGGGAALAAAEQDVEGLIDGVAVSEPMAQPRHTRGLQIVQGTQPVATLGKPLVDYFSFANVYQPCAALAAGLSLSPALWPAAYTAAAQNRCGALAARGLVSGSTVAEQAADALARLHAYGWPEESDFLQPSHFRFATSAIAVTYANALGRFSVLDNLCGYSFANTDATGAVSPQLAVQQAGLFATGNGIPPTTGINLVWNEAVGGARLDFLAASPTSGLADFALDGALCLRARATGRDPITGQALVGTAAREAARVRQGVREVQLEARLQGKPVLIVAGRNDALLPVNHAARAYFGQTQRQSGGQGVRLIEVTNAQHFDSFIALGALLGYDSRFIPLHVYFNRAMDAMWAHLRQGQPLPASQVVRTVPRGGVTGAAPALQAEHLPPWSRWPAAGDRIEMDGQVLRIPQ